MSAKEWLDQNRSKFCPLFYEAKSTEIHHRDLLLQIGDIVSSHPNATNALSFLGKLVDESNKMIESLDRGIERLC